MRTRKALVLLVVPFLALASACDDEDGVEPQDDVSVDAVDAPADVVTDVVEDDAEEVVELPAITIPGLSAEVTAYYDEQGVLHAYCQTNNDCVAVQGYFHARDRFVQMDLRRRLGRGRLATIAGSPALQYDRPLRTRFMTRDGRYLEEAIWDASSSTTQAAIEAYTRGVNAWLEDYRAGRNGAALSDEYGLSLLYVDEIPDWEVYDTTAVGVVLAFDLSNDASGDLSRARRFEGLDPAVILDVFGETSLTGNSTLGAVGETFDKARPGLDAGGLSTALARLASSSDIIARALHQSELADRFRTPGRAGSNNWVIGPSRTTSGTAILANDPHLALTNPPLWYMVHLDSKTNGQGDLHITGVSFAGTPTILIGRNENIAWGATVASYDMTDVYVEELDETGNKVIFDGGEVDILRVSHTYEVAGGDPVAEDILIVPHHGPILEYDAENRQAISMRWTGNEFDTDFDGFFGLATAADVEEARTALENMTTTNQNWVVIDTQNNIGWFPYCRVPIRSWASMETPPWLPVPGDGSVEWEGYMDYADLPQLLNPDAGFVATANQDMTGALADGDPTNDGYNMLQSTAADGMRHQRIVDLIEEIDDAHSLEGVVGIQGDVYSLLGAGMVPEVLEAVAGATLDESTTRVVDALEDWEYTCPTGVLGSGDDIENDPDPTAARESIGCLAFHMLIVPLAEAMFSDELEGSNANASGARRAAYNLLVRPEVLLNGEDYWDDVLTNDAVETEEDIVLEALGNAATALESLAGTDPDDWRWGRYHQIELYGFLFVDFGIEDYNHDPFPAPGGTETVNPAGPRSLNPASPNLTYRHSASMRFVSQVTAEGMRSVMSFPGGQRHFRDSPFYNNLLDDYLRNEPFELLFDAEDVEAAAVETFRFESGE